MPAPEQPTPKSSQPVQYRDFLDTESARKNIFDGVAEGVKTKFPLSNDKYQLDLDNVRYDSPKEFTLAEQKKAILSRSNLDWKLKGTWRLRDKATGQVIDESDKVVARVPYMTPRGTFIHHGNEYTLASQQRLRPGVYSRVKDNGDVESHFNIIPGTGMGFRMEMEPSTGVFKIHAAQSSVPLYPLLKTLGATDQDLQQSWGRDVWHANVAKRDSGALKKLYDRLVDTKTKKQFGEDVSGALRSTFDRMKLDPEVSQRNLGHPHDTVSHGALSRTAQKLLHIHQGSEQSDDRDSQANQMLMAPEDLFKERIVKDAGQAQRKLLWKVTAAGHLQRVPSQALSGQILSTLLYSGLGQPLTEINTLDLLDQQVRVSRLGEGGMGSGAVPAESRNVQPSQMGFVDIVKAPESGQAGVDSRFALGTYRGSDGQLYRDVLNTKTGKMDRVTARQAVHATMAFPGEMDNPLRRKVRAMQGEKIRWVNRNKVDYVLPHPEHMFSVASNLVPGFSGVKGGRLLMGSKFGSQALPLKDPEAPLVQSANPEGGTYEELFGRKMGVVHAKQEGHVVGLSPDAITVRHTDGSTQEHQLYNNFIFNQKTAIHSTPLVKTGDHFKAGQILAKSNYTDPSGTLAMGRNLRVAYLPFDSNYEDAMVISESAAKKLQSEHMSQLKFDLAEGDTVGRNAHLSIYPGRFTKDQLNTIGEDGVVKPGSIVRHGDPLVLAVGTRRPQGGMAVHKGRGSYSEDKSQTWDHHGEGEVTDVWRDGDGVKVAVKSHAPMLVGDKLSARHGMKGVVSRIVPDDQMPRDAQGQPFETLLNPLGIISRVNPAYLAEMALGKIARKTGKPYAIRAFTPNLGQFALDELKKHGLSETEDVFDPATHRTLKNIYTGETFLSKLYHTAASKEGGRDIGAYTSEGSPAKGGADGAKRVGNLDTLALISHGAIETLKDAKLIRGQKNDKFWANFRAGLPVRMPGNTPVYDKFLSYLKGAGINMQQSGDRFTMLPLTDAGISEVSRGKLTTGDAVNAKDNNPVPGGLFDVGITGGHQGKHYAHIDLHEPMLNPIMEDSARRLLGMTKPELERTIATEGGHGLQQKLAAINIDSEIKKQRDAIASGKHSARDLAVKRLGILEAAKRSGIHPKDWMWTKAPVVPPAFRPVTLADGMQLTSDANLLYKELFEADQNLRKMSGHTADVGPERVASYNALKAVSGLGQPEAVKLQEKNVGGLLEHVFGKSSPKTGQFQRRVLANAVDVVGRGVVSPDHALDMDQVGIPESKAWNVYQPFIMRRLARMYNTGDSKVPLTQLAKWVADRDPRARKALLQEMEARPVLMHRAPVLHRYGFMAYRPVLTPGETVRVSPIVTAGLGMDFDGDTVNYHVPVSDSAVKEAYEKLLPSKHLLSASDFDVHYLPRQEFLHGLFTATRPVKASKHGARDFATKKDAIAAYRHGDLNVDELVRIIEDERSH